jgi:hypothetical protein
MIGILPISKKPLFACSTIKRSTLAPRRIPEVFHRAAIGVGDPFDGAEVVGVVPVGDVDLVAIDVIKKLGIRSEERRGGKEG